MWRPLCGYDDIWIRELPSNVTTRGAGGGLQAKAEEFFCGRGRSLFSDEVEIGSSNVDFGVT